MKVKIGIEFDSDFGHAYVADALERVTHDVFVTHAWYSQDKLRCVGHTEMDATELYVKLYDSVIHENVTVEEVK